MAKVISLLLQQVEFAPPDRDGTFSGSRLAGMLICRLGDARLPMPYQQQTRLVRLTAILTGRSKFPCSLPKANA